MPSVIKKSRIKSGKHNIMTELFLNNNYSYQACVSYTLIVEKVLFYLSSLYCPQCLLRLHLCAIYSVFKSATDKFFFYF